MARTRRPPTGDWLEDLLAETTRLEARVSAVIFWAWAVLALAMAAGVAAWVAVGAGLVESAWVVAVSGWADVYPVAAWAVLALAMEAAGSAPNRRRGNPRRADGTRGWGIAPPRWSRR